MHVAVIHSTQKGKTYESVLLRQTYRDGGKVKHRTLANLSQLPPQTIDVIRRSLRGENLVAASDAFKVVRSRAHGSVAAVWHTLRELELDKLLGSRPAEWKNVALAMIAARVVRPGSKRFTRGWWEHTTLPQLAGLPAELPKNACYDALDHLLARQPAVERALAARHLQDGCLVLYDVSSSYVKGRHCPLAAFGHNRDRKQGHRQITYGLVTDRRGRPVAIEVFPGNRSDPVTAKDQIERLRERYHLSRVVMVGDRGMLTSSRITDLAKVGYGWITCLRAKDMQNLYQRGIVALYLFEGHNLAEVSDPERPTERLVACRNPLMTEERRRKREELLAATEIKLQAVANRVAKGRLVEEQAIGIAVGKVVDRLGMAKHFMLEIGPGRFSFRRNSETITREAALDGVYVVRTSVPASELASQEVVDSYRALQQVEQAFRSLQTTHRQIRPLLHRLEDRIRAHAFLCMLAYYVRWHMAQSVRPLLDQAPAYGSFRLVIEKLHAIQLNDVEVAGQTFTRPTEPDAEQRRMLDLLGVKIA